MNNFVLFFITGQSNTQGTNSCVNLHDQRDHVDSRILSWNIYEHKWEIANLASVIGTKPANNQCFAFHFAKEYLKQYPYMKVGLIVYGSPNTSINHWVPPNVHLPPSNDIFKKDIGNVFVDTVNVISEAIKAAGRNYLDGVLWHQGEADFMETYEYYYYRIKHVIFMYRHYFSHPTKGLPFIVGELLSYTYFGKQNVILRALQNEDQLTRCASLFGLEHAPGDPLHLSTEGNRLMGQRYFNEYKMLFN